MGGCWGVFGSTRYLILLHTPLQLQWSAHLNVQSTILGEMRDEMRGKHRKIEKESGGAAEKDKSG